jgi:hypothetical protein
MILPFGVNHAPRSFYRVPSLLLLRAGLLVLAHQMERGFATRPLQQGPMLVDRGEQNARGPCGFAPPQKHTTFAPARHDR